MSSRAWNVVAMVGLANFIVFFVAAIVLGGDAVNGTIANGRYYLSSHGKLTEVSRAVFEYSRYHVYSLVLTHPLAMYAGWHVQRAKKAAERGPGAA